MTDWLSDWMKIKYIEKGALLIKMNKQSYFRGKMTDLGNYQKNMKKENKFT